MGKMISGIGYVRVSTSPQLKNYSPDQQAQMIEQYAEANGIRLIGAPILDAKSGRTLDRAGLTRVRELASSGRVQAVVVAFVDRLARNVEYVNTLRRQFAETGVDLHIVSIGRVTDSPEAGLMMNITGSMAQYEVEQFARRSMLGKIGKAKAGKGVANGVPSYGFRREGERGDARPVKVAEQVKVVQRIFDEYTRDRIGIRSISDGLNRDKIPSADGGVWWWSAVKRILSNRSYLGEFEYRGIIIPYPDLAIIDLEQFDLAQRLKAQNKERAKRNRKHEYLLSNRLRCACGRKMFGESGDRYRCNAMSLPSVIRTCHFGKVYKSSIEPTVWAYVRALLQPEHLEQGAASVEKTAAKRRQTPSRADTVKNEIEKLKKQIAALMDRFGDDDMLASMAEQKMRDMSSAIRGLEAELGALRTTRRDASLDATARASVLENSELLRAMLDEPDDVVRKKVLDALGVMVEMRTRANGERGIVIETVFGTSKVIGIRHNPGWRRREL